jgi:tetratricopeptide (TPR) repeat protein
MFSIHIYLRFALIALFLGFGILAAALPKVLGFWWGFPFLLAGIVLLVGYLLLGTVQSAALFLQTSQLDEAEKRLKLTFFPNLLYVTNRAYYYILRGSLASARQNSEEAEMWLKKAQTMKLPTDNEKAMIELQLANIAATKGKWQQAQNAFRNLKNLKITDANIKDQMRQFEKVLQQRGQLKSAGMHGNNVPLRPGGKRRRPKMR